MNTIITKIRSPQLKRTSEVVKLTQNIEIIYLQIDLVGNTGATLAISYGIGKKF